MDLKIDPARDYDEGAEPEALPFPLTGILVRAQRPNGEWDNAEIGQLTRDSLITWLKSRGGDNPWAEEVVCILLNRKDNMEKKENWDAVED